MNADVRTNPFDLQQLIASENDPRQRVLLMLVQQGNENVAENTRAVEANAAAVNNIAKDLEALFVKFEERARADDALKNQGKGAGRIVMGVISVAQVIGLWIWKDTREEMKAMHAAIVASQKAEATLETRVTSIEAATRTNRTGQ